MSLTTHAGVTLPKMLYGTAWKKERTAALVAQALEAGFRGIDTACQPKHYEEPLVGQAIAAALEAGLDRDALYLQTKFTPLGGQDPKKIPYDPNSSLSEQVAYSFQVSLKNLHVSYLDSYILHSPLFPHSDLMKVWQAMETIADAGGARQLGISNIYDFEWLKRLYNDARIKPAVVQNRFYADSGYDKEIRAFCKDNGMVYQSFWSLTANPHLLGSKEVFELCRKYSLEAPQIFYAFLSHEGIVPLNGTTSQEHMQADLEALHVTLAPEEAQSIRELL